MIGQAALFIGGEWLSGGGRDVVPIHNPATGETVAELTLASDDDLERALDAAAVGFETWRRVPAIERARLLHETARLLRERADAVARTLTTEQGKLIAEAKGEVLVTAAYLDELAEVGARISGRLLGPDVAGVERVVVNEPIGPVFAVSPWNLPAMMPGRKIANSLAAGCSIVLKPARETPQTACLLAACCEDAGIPPGVVNVVSGEASLVSRKMIASETIRKVSFTGSTEVGKKLAALAGAHMKKITMELGGHAPVVVFDDVDIERVVGLLVPARHHNAGQSCMAATRFFVQSGIYDAFVEAYGTQTAALRVGDGIEPDSDMGPLTSERRLPVMDSLVNDAVGAGAGLVTGGRRLDRQGWFYAPTVLRDVPARAAIMAEEPFGPVTPFAAFRDVEEVIGRANETPYGLAAYVFTNNETTGRHVAASLDAGIVGINTTQVAGPAVPFGGVRDSGVGREGALEGVLESMTTKTVSLAR